MVEQLSPERVARLLRAKAAELEASVLAMDADRTRPATSREVSYLAADIALVASLLADLIERTERKDEQLRQMYAYLADKVIDPETGKRLSEPLDIDDANVRDMRDD